MPRWIHVQPQGRPRKSCEGHTVSVVDRVLYILFGKHEDDMGHVVCPPLTMLDTETMILSTPLLDTMSGGRRTVPEDREGHSAAVIGHRIYVFGGTWTEEDESTLYMNDLHVLDTSTKPPSWSRPPQSPTATPIEREGHTAIVIGHRMIVFGGTWVDDDDNSRYLNDVHVYDVDANYWSTPETHGQTPIEREGHTASAIGRSMLVFGGAGLDDVDRSINLSDLHVLDTDTWVWSQPRLGSEVLPQERRYHTASVIDRKVYVFGGQYYDPTADLHFECDNIVSCFDVDAMSWETLQIDGQPPLRRACHASGTIGHLVYIVGGRYWDISEDDYIFMNDIQVLDTSPRSTFSSDWRQYFNNSHLSDIELVVDGRRIAAHRVVLAARCEHFSRMLLSGMKEAHGAEVEIAGVRYEVFMALLEYLYTDTMDFTPDIALELLSAADRFGLERLKRECITLIEAGLTTATVCHVLTIADRHSADDLKEVCLNYVTSHFPEVIRTEGFQALTRELLDQVHFAMANRHYPDKEARLEKEASAGSGTPRTLTSRLNALAVSSLAAPSSAVAVGSTSASNGHSDEAAGGASIAGAGADPELSASLAVGVARRRD